MNDFTAKAVASLGGNDIYPLLLHFTSQCCLSNINQNY